MGTKDGILGIDTEPRGALVVDGEVGLACMAGVGVTVPTVDVGVPIVAALVEGVGSTMLG